MLRFFTIFLILAQLLSATESLLNFKNNTLLHLVSTNQNDELYAYLNKEAHGNRNGITIKPNGNIVFDKTALDNNLTITGVIFKESRGVDISITANEFLHQQDEFSAKVALNLHLRIDQNSTLDGNILILETLQKGDILNNILSKDDDIVIVNDLVKEQQINRLSLDIVIASKEKLLYSANLMKFNYSLMLQIKKESSEQEKVSGNIIIYDGNATISDREFEFDKSEILFQNSPLFNPFLNLHLRHTTHDHIEIMLSVANSAESATVTLSSNPPMSQNDIISYILFGGSASSVFEVDSHANSSSKLPMSGMIVGGGLKEILNKSASLQIDTLNIITNKDGSIGYEIGSKISRDFRVAYKNEDSSNLTLQYNLTRALRFDILMRQSGQGIAIFYMKDF